jgi:hypothetical protein
LFVRTALGSDLAKEAAGIIHDMDGNLPLIEVRMLEDVFADSIARDRLNAVVFAGFSVFALLLASVGLYVYSRSQSPSAPQRSVSAWRWAPMTGRY